MRILIRIPRVARALQPWAGGHNPFGIADGIAPRDGPAAGRMAGVEGWTPDRKLIKLVQELVREGRL